MVNILGEAQKNETCPPNIREALDHAMVGPVRTSEPHCLLSISLFCVFLTLVAQQFLVLHKCEIVLNVTSFQRFCVEISVSSGLRSTGHCDVV